MNKTRYRLQALIDFGGRHIYQDNRDNTEYNEISSKQLNGTMRSFVIKMGTIFLSFIVAVIGPAQAYLSHGTKTTTIESHIPFLEPKSNSEFVANFLLQNLIAIHGILGYIGVEIVLSLYQDVVTVAPKLLTADLAHAIRQYEDKSITEQQLRMRIQNIVKQSHDTDV